MVVRRCPQCGTASDDQYGFCYKCGCEFPKVVRKPSQCPLCGFENPDEADFCVKCGTPLVFKNQFISDDVNVRPIVINKSVSEGKGPQGFMKWLVVFGYLFSVLGGLLGLIIALYLVTRKDATLRKHGTIQLAIFAFYIILIAILYSLGMIPADALSNYQQLILGNYTLP